jgi:NAD+ kinase
MSRAMLLVVHPTRADAVDAAAIVAGRLQTAGVAVRVLEKASALPAALLSDAVEVVPADEQAAVGCELVVVLGGDGTLLRAAELARPAGVPLLGINLGHVGFLADAEPDDLPRIVEQVVAGAYEVEERMTLEVRVSADSEVLVDTWALNDASVEKVSRERMLDVLVEIDARPLSRWGCDGVVCATPTGSTAYAFSAGGPVVWPEVAALLLVPISAHALFARPLVVAPTSVLAIDVLAPEDVGAVLWCDGRRMADVPSGGRVEVRRGASVIKLARLHPGPFTDRLVAKFQLPVAGWRGGGEPQGAGPSTRSFGT